MKFSKSNLSLVLMIILSLTIRSFKAAEIPALSPSSSSSERLFPLSDSIDILYRWPSCPNPMLYLSPTEIESYNNMSDFMKLSNATFLKEGEYEREALNPEDWTTLCQKLHDQALRDKLNNRYKQIKNKWLVSLEEGQQLLEDTKLILKSFLPVNEFDPEKEKEAYIQKNSALERLYTYTKLQLTIQNKKLSHIHLPRKILIIKNRKTGKLLTTQQASDLLDQLMKIVVIFNEYEPLFLPRLQIKFLEDNNYDFYVYAEKQIHSNLPLSKIAMEELVELVKDAPFDIGYNNIFSDQNGDAVIIDTEFKGEHRSHSLPKLVRRYASDKLIEEIWPKVQEWLIKNK